ncbi:odorant receptor 131-2-like [Gadus chalcogrammus]|uniref:odorant receptor 131-2-like n=1 Tax=Gadus chalcogrammus TaxID=1042646 RepID=UPI0024C27D3B|nr:odorant receptor 131-2-like [Gadus chalcogrammus]
MAFFVPAVRLGAGHLRANVSNGLQYLENQEYILYTTFSVGLGCTFLCLNCVLLYTLRSKPVFRETSRYILLYNLLFADTAHLALSLLLYILAVSRLMLTMSVCGLLTMFSIYVESISPLTLAVMSVERYVAVCFPLRHADLVTIRKTGAAIAAVWTVCSLNIVIRVLILVWRPDYELNEKMKDFCSKEAMFLTPMTKHFDEAYSSFVFLFGGLAIVFSYVGVTLVARSASSDKASVRKAGKTVLLHFFQLVLILTFTLNSIILTAFARQLDRKTLVRLSIIIFVCLNLFPRCLSALIYGLRDQTLRPALLNNIGCQLRCLVGPNKTKFRKRT